MCGELTFHAASASIRSIAWKIDEVRLRAFIFTTSYSAGSVRGVGAGGIVSSAVSRGIQSVKVVATQCLQSVRPLTSPFHRLIESDSKTRSSLLQFCLLYKLYTLKLTRKQVNGLIKHTDSPYIRGLGFMYIRYTAPPADLFDWYEEFLQDEEEIDVKAGGGLVLTIGQMCRQFLVKLDWFSTLFPRIPVPIQKQIEQKLGDYDRKHGIAAQPAQQQRYVAPPAEPRRDRNNWDKPKEREYRDERKRSRSKERRRYDDEPSSYRQSRR